jgi:hypothetical protein
MTRTSLQRSQKVRSVVQKSRSKEFSVGRGRWRFENRDLLPQGEDLKGRVTSTAEEDTDHGKEGEDEFGHEITLVTCRNMCRHRQREETANR